MRWPITILLRATAEIIHWLGPVHSLVVYVALLPKFKIIRWDLAFDVVLLIDNWLCLNILNWLLNNSLFNEFNWLDNLFHNRLSRS